MTQTSHRLRAPAAVRLRPVDLVALASIGLLVINRHHGHVPVYSVTTVRVHLERDPAHWVGRHRTRRA